MVKYFSGFINLKSELDLYFKFATILMCAECQSIKLHFIFSDDENGFKEHPKQAIITASFHVDVRMDNKESDSICLVNSKYIKSFAYSLQ